MNFTEELWDDLRSPKAIAALAAGSTSGFSILIARLAFATFIFSGALAPYATQGIGFMLAGTVVGLFVTALASSYRGVIVGLSPALVLGMVGVAATFETTDDALFVSTIMAFVLCAVFTGLCCLALGWFRLAHVVRFVPYPVSAGFVAGIGGAVCIAAFELMITGAQRSSLQTLFDPSILWCWIPGITLGIGLYLLIKRWQNSFILPVTVGVFVVAYHLTLALLDISRTDARDLGLLLQSTSEGNLWPPFGFDELQYIDWTAIAIQLPEMFALIVVAFIAIVMNIAALEVAIQSDLDWNRELKTSGLSSVIGGVSGGTISTIVVGGTLRGKLFGATTRLNGIVAAMVILSALVFGDGILEFIPTALIGGILIFAGLGLLEQGLVKTYFKLPRMELLIVVLIGSTIIGLGLLEGVGIGMLVTLIFFAVRLSRVDPIEDRYSLKEQRSNKSRSIPDRVILTREGEHVLAYRLHGYIFFGSVHALVERLGKEALGSDRPICLMLDFNLVTGIDYSAVSALARFLNRVISAQVPLVLCGLSPQQKSELERDLDPSVRSEIVIEATEDQALERCEDMVLNTWRARDDSTEERRRGLLGDTSEELERHLERQTQFEALVDELKQWLQPKTFGIGDELNEPQEANGQLWLLTMGCASVFDANGTRIHQYMPGDAILPLTNTGTKRVSIVADESCCTMSITLTDRRWLEANRSELIMKLYAFLIDSPSVLNQDLIKS